MDIAVSDPMDDMKLADGERIVRTYRCTATDGCRVIAGTALPTKRSKYDSEGTVTVTNRRLVYSMTARSRKGDSMIRQEVRISDITSISALMAKFGRDIRVPMMMVILGFILMFAPFVYATETGMLDHGQDYKDGYNVGTELGYYEKYLGAISAGTVKNTIPSGYSAPEYDTFGSSEYVKGYEEGVKAGEDRAKSDIEGQKPFAVPSDLRMGVGIEGAIVAVAVIGAVVFVMGSVLYAISSRTKDWVRFELGSGVGAGVCLKSFASGEDASAIGPLSASEGYSQMVGELGSLIAELRTKESTETGVRV